MYKRKTWTDESDVPYPNWYEQKKRLKDNYWYKMLPAQSAQEVLKQLHEAWKSYFKLLKTKRVENPKPPRFKHENFNIRFLNNSFKILGNKIRLTISKQMKEYFKQKYSIQPKFLYIDLPKEINGRVKIIEIIPLDKKYKVNIISDLPDAIIKEDNGIYMGIDLGINNLAAIYVSKGKNYLISGRQILSINRYFGKKIAYYQSIAYKGQTVKGIKHLKPTKRIIKLYQKRSKQIFHAIHAATKKIIDLAKENDVSKIIIGDLKGIKNGKNLGTVNNQKFHSWAFSKIVEQIRYKAEEQGIEVILIDESYTSSCSPYSEDVNANYASKDYRKFRGLFIVSGRAYNADSVGAYNILRKYLRGIGKPSPAVVALDTPVVYLWNPTNAEAYKAVSLLSNFTTKQEFILVSII
ncbi:MAG: RNA-guided endonuclease InsQ/TnpB family protein [Thermovenabulum sp.]|uniref:RNA-guided endonuclease InsQ/TnpB family protein n=1 Tax=Thermovenabulum sp. TaxID=3100335 RepID=UPI003C7D75C4